MLQLVNHIVLPASHDVGGGSGCWLTSNTGVLFARHFSSRGRSLGISACLLGLGRCTPDLRGLPVRACVG